MIQRLNELKQTALRELEAVNDLANLESWRVRYLGRKSELTNMLRGLADLPIEERKSAGAAANRIKDELAVVLEQKTEALKIATQQQVLHSDDTATARGDITLPGRPVPTGRIHPITETFNEICDIFVSLGFQVVESNDVELDYYNFEALKHSGRTSVA